MQRTLTVFCDGGLGNRLGSLVGGLTVADTLKIQKIKICWPANNWCGCYFDDLFSNTNFEVSTETINQIFVPGTDQAFLVHENQTGADLGIQLSQNPQSIDYLATIDNDVVYYHNKIAPYMNSEQVQNMANVLKPAHTIKKQVLDFCSANQIDRAVMGLHLRKTENFRLDEEKLYRRVSANSAQKYFACSDDQTTEQRFAGLPNVVTCAKTSYVEKLVEGDWLAQTVDADGRRYNYNINRPRQSVVEAFVDMLILSQTSIQFTVKSSFSKFAEVFAKTQVLHD